MKKAQVTQESGFTLIELLVVILIIGILAAIAVPVFMNQRKKAAIASVQSDLKNAALSMESEAVGNKGKFLSYVPNYNPRSAGVQVSLNNIASSENKFCLTGKSEVYSDILFSYDSVSGGLLDKGQACAPVSAGDTSFTNIRATKKALIVYARGDNQEPMGDAPMIASYLKSYGFGTVDSIYNPDASVYSGYDVIIAKARGWSVPGDVLINLNQGYGNGAHIFTDGNDASKSNFSKFIKEDQPSTGGGAEFNQTGATGLNPPFPYTFTNSSFPNDGWVCPLEMQPGVIVIATTPNVKNLSQTCVTASAMSSGNGRWIHLAIGPMTGNTSMVDSSMNWLIS